MLICLIQQNGMLRFHQSFAAAESFDELAQQLMIHWAVFGLPHACSDVHLFRPVRRYYISYVVEIDPASQQCSDPLYLLNLAYYCLVGLNGSFPTLGQHSSNAILLQDRIGFSQVGLVRSFMKGHIDFIAHLRSEHAQKLGINSILDGIGSYNQPFDSQLAQRNGFLDQQLLLVMVQNKTLVVVPDHDHGGDVNNFNRLPDHGGGWRQSSNLQSRDQLNTICTRCLYGFGIRGRC